jgi:hypothetical protein
MLIKKLTVKGVERNGRSLSEVISQHFPRRIEEHEKNKQTSMKIICVWAQIWTQNLPN